MWREYRYMYLKHSAFWKKYLNMHLWILLPFVYIIYYVFALFVIIGFIAAVWEYYCYIINIKYTQCPEIN